MKEDEEEYVDLFAIETVISNILCEIKKYIADEMKNEGEDFSEEKIKHHPLYVLMTELKRITNLFVKLLRIKKSSYSYLLKNNLCLRGIVCELEHYISDKTKSNEKQNEENFKNHPLYIPLTKLEVMTDCLAKYVKKYKKEDEEEE
jgi:predicted nucleotidyltransferase